MKTETRQLLQDAANEIRSLRHVIEHQSAKLEVYDTFRAAIVGRAPMCGLSPCIAHAIERHLEEDKPSPYICGVCSAELPYPLTTKICPSCGGDCTVNNGPKDNPQFTASK